MAYPVSPDTLQALRILSTRINQRLAQQPATDQPQALRRYWKTHQQRHITDTETALRLLLQARIETGRIHPRFAACLPPAPDLPGLAIKTLALRIHTGEVATLNGCLMFTLNEGATLLWLATSDWKAFASPDQALAALTALLNRPLARGALTETLRPPQRQDATRRTRPYQQRDWQLRPVRRPAFATLHWQLLGLQLSDMTIAQALPATLGPGAALQTLLEDIHTPPAKAPHWLRYAPAEQADACLTALMRYDHARALLHDTLGGCDSAEHFATLHLQASIANDLGLAVEPQYVQSITRRTLPQTDEPYETRRSLTHLALSGLHAGDSEPGSAFLTTTHFVLHGQPLHALTPAYVATLIERLGLRAGFAAAQRAAYRQPRTRSLMHTTLLQRIAAQAWCARLQGLVTSSDQQRLATFAADGGAHERLSSANLLLAGQYRPSDILVVRHQHTDGTLARLLLCCPHSPRQPLCAFDNERQLIAEVVGWSADLAMRNYLLDSVVAQQRQAFGHFLQQLEDKPFTHEQFLTLTFHPGHQALDALTQHRIEVIERDTAVLTPTWLASAAASQQRQLSALDDQIEAAVQRYADAAHTRLPEFERYVHAHASRQLNRLLEREDDPLDPDTLIVRSPRETLTYTRLLRDGYDDSLGWLNATADTSATFHGPPGVDLSLLTSQRVAGSVRGQWVSDRYVELIENTLLSPEHEGHAWRRRQSVLIVQLQLYRAALASHLQGQLDAEQYAWVLETLHSFHHTDAAQRTRHALYPLRLRIDNELLADEPLIGELFNALYRLMDKEPPYREETVHGCLLLTAPGGGPAQTLIYTPAAPDHVTFRPLAQFARSLATPGMIDYYKDRSRKHAGQLLSFLLADIRDGGKSQPPTLPDDPLTDLRSACYDAPLQQRIIDVRDSSRGRADMIASITWNTLEIAAQLMTLPFPPAAFTVGAVLALRDYQTAMAAFIGHDSTVGSLYLLSSLLNAAGAYGDLTQGMKGFAGLLRKAEQLPQHPQQLDEARRLLLDNLPGKPEPFTSAVQVDLSEGVSARAAHAQGITLANGRPHVQIDGEVFQVQFDARQQYWKIVDPDNPFAFSGSQPVRRQADGRWQRVEASGLRGGEGGAALPPSSGAAAHPALPSEQSPFWNTYMQRDHAQAEALSDQALARQTALLDDAGLPRLEEGQSAHMDEHQFEYVLSDEGEPSYTFRNGDDYSNYLIGHYTDENAQINSYLRRGVHEFAFCDSDTFVDKLVDSLQALPRNSDVTLYRGGSGSRSTSGAHFRSGQLKVGDVLVNSDLASFTENPYVLRDFASDKELLTPAGVAGVFDDTSVIFELPAGHYQSGVPVAALSWSQQEAETLFAPGALLRIEQISEVVGDDFRFVHVRLREIPGPVTQPVHDLRTGAVFDRAQYAAMLDNADLVERFFPAEDWPPLPSA